MRKLIVLSHLLLWGIIFIFNGILSVIISIWPGKFFFGFLFILFVIYLGFVFIGRQENGKIETE